MKRTLQNADRYSIVVKVKVDYTDAEFLGELFIWRLSMFCLNCGTRLPDEAVFCNKCGKQQEVITNTPISDTAGLSSLPLHETSQASGLSGDYNITQLPEKHRLEFQYPSHLRPSPDLQGTQSNQHKLVSHLSRREVMVGLAGATVVTVVAGGAILISLARKKQASSLSASSIFTPTPLPLGTTIYIYRGHSDLVEAVDWSPDGRYIASGGADLTAQVWTAFTGNTVLTYRGHSNEVSDIAWSPDGRRIASASLDGTVQVCDALTGNNVLTYSGNSNEVSTVAWSPDGQRIASGSFETQVWDATTGNTFLTYHDDAAFVLDLAWSPEGRWLATGGQEKTVQVWNATTGNTVFTYRGHYGFVSGVAWSPDGQRIASASFDGTVQVWDATTGNNSLTYRGHSREVYDVVWSPDGKHLASASFDKTVQIWDSATGNSIFIYRGHSNSVGTLAWSPDGKYIASGGGGYHDKNSDTTVRVWQAE